jgi:Ca2+-binding RTX toxin-like protein
MIDPSTATGTAAGSVVPGRASAGLTINVNYDPSITSLQSSNPTLYTEYTSAIQTAVQFWEGNISNPITVSIDFGWGEADNQAVTGLGESYTDMQSVPYSQLYNALKATETTSAVQLAAVASLPASDPTTGGTWEVPDSEAQALGLMPVASASPQWVGLGSQIQWSWSQSNVASNTYDAIGTLEHEISETLGRLDDAGTSGRQTNIYTPLDLFRYTAANGSATAPPGAPAGVRDEPFVAGYNPNAYSYFSYNGTTVTLPYDTPAQVARGDDIADWNSVPDDSFDGLTAPGAPDLVSAIDLQEMNVLGYDLASATPSTPISGLSVVDTTTGQPVSATGQPYAGPVAGLTSQYLNITTDSLNISVSTPNWFIHSGSGNDAIQVSSGTNVLDGGTGSNFLTGGSGSDTFFVDDRGPTADIWSTVNNFHAGDAATIWGVTPNDFSLAWFDGQGAPGFTGLTLHATSPGRPTASLTLAGFTSGALNNGQLSVIYGTSGASPYMYIHDNS